MFIIFRILDLLVLLSIASSTLGLKQSFHFNILGLRTFSSTPLLLTIIFDPFLCLARQYFGGGGAGLVALAGLLLCFLEGESFRECDDVGGIEMVYDDYVEA